MKDLFKYQTAADQPELAAYLHALAEAVGRGEIVVSENGKKFTLCPRGLVNVSIKVRRKEGRSRVNLDLTWAEETPETPLLDDLQDGAPEWL